MNMTRDFAAIVLAAGKGTRMKSDLHKVLHPIAGRPMLDHLLATVDALQPAKKVVVVGAGRDQLENALAGSAETCLQEPQLGTGHAVQQAEESLADHSGDVLVLYGDVPFVKGETMQAMLDRLHAEDRPKVVVLGFEPDDPGHYGRVIADADGRIDKMVEFKDASEEERACRLCNSGVMAARSADMFELLRRVGNDNAQGEYYLVDIVNIANADGDSCAVVSADTPAEVTGINSRAELARAEAQWQELKREEAMTEGVTLTAPDTVFFSWDTDLAADVTVEPHVVFGPGVSVARGARIRAPRATLTPGPKTTCGSTVTSAARSVSQLKNTVSGAVSVTPSVIASSRLSSCHCASARASSARLLMPVTSAGVSADTTAQLSPSALAMLTMSTR